MKKMGIYTCFFYALVSSLGGLIFGFNTSVLSGALFFLETDFLLSTFLQELIVSMILIGALIGAFFAGIITEKGRKKALYTCAILYALGAILIVLSHSIWLILLGRLIGGLGLGVSSVCVPLYIAEISPSKVRGAFVSLNQLAITIGILLGYISNYIFAPYESWRSMIGLQFIFLVLFFLLLFFLPETPSFLASLGKIEKAKKLRESLGHVESTGEGKIATRKKEKEEKGLWTRLFKKPLSIPFIIGIGLSIFQQITGINTIIYYAPQIFTQAGFASTQSAILATIGIGVVNVVMTIASLFLIDKMGRRPLLLLGLLGMTLSLTAIGTLFYFESGLMGIGAIICLFFYITFFAISLGPIAWLIISEVFPLEIRGKAMGFAITANWICNVIVSLTFLTLLETLTPSYTFYLYACISVLGFFFVYFKVFETKGKTFAEIQKNYLKNPRKSL
jgi:MFS transporter, SP family, galactose:H+ symporter